jgi:hypothetical protein
MAHLKGLTNLGVELNPPHLGDWPRTIGSYMMNFAAIELISFHYLDKLEETRADFDKNLNRMLSERIDRILQLITGSSKVHKSDKDNFELLWRECRELSKWRNRIAHNPVLPTWKPESNTNLDPPDLIGIPDMRQLQSGDISNSISLQGMQKLVLASADLGKRLHEAAQKL